MGAGEGAALPASSSSTEEKLSAVELAQLRRWALEAAALMPCGRARTLLFLLAVTEEEGSIWNRITKARFKAGTGLSKSGVKKVLRELAQDRQVRVRQFEDAAGSNGVNEYALPVEQALEKKGGGRKRPAAQKKAPRVAREEPVNFNHYIVTQNTGVGQ
jgi:hypothetical protein